MKESSYSVYLECRRGLKTLRKANKRLYRQMKELEKEIACNEEFIRLGEKANSIVGGVPVHVSERESWGTGKLDYEVEGVGKNERVARVYVNAHTLKHWGLDLRTGFGPDHRSDFCGAMWPTRRMAVAWANRWVTRGESPPEKMRWHKDSGKRG